MEKNRTPQEIRIHKKNIGMNISGLLDVYNLLSIKISQNQDVKNMLANMQGSWIAMILRALPIWNFLLIIYLRFILFFCFIIFHFLF